MKPIRMYLANVGLRSLSDHNLTPPLGVLCLAAYIRERVKAEIRVVNQRLEAWSCDAMTADIVAFEPDIVGLSSTTLSAHLLRDITGKVRKALPESLVVIGGPHASAQKENALEECQADIAVVGEGELAFEKVVQTYLDNREYSTIPGLIWRDSDGLVRANPGSIPLIPDLDALPMPAYDLIDMTQYWSKYSAIPIPRRKYVSLISSRGCPFQCNYCHNIFGKRFRPHSAERIVEEIEYHRRTLGVDDFEFVDDVFNFDYDRAMEVAESIIEKNLRVKLAFPGGFRTDILTEEFLEAMAAAGTYFASFALESGSERIQRQMGKNLNIPSFVEGVENAVKCGILTNGFALFGFPTETEEEMRQTVDVMCNSKLHMGHFLTVMPFPGTPLHRDLERTAPEKLHRVRYDNQTTQNFRVNFSSVPDRVLFSIQRNAVRRFYLSPGRVMRNLRDYPCPHRLVYFAPMFLRRATKGLL